MKSVEAEGRKFSPSTFLSKTTASMNVIYWCGTDPGKNSLELMLKTVMMSVVEGATILN
jgi:hypothetical protein